VAERAMRVGAKTRCAPREIGDLQAGRYFWHPTRIARWNSCRQTVTSQRRRTPSRASTAATCWADSSTSTRPPEFANPTHAHATMGTSGRSVLIEGQRRRRSSRSSHSACASAMRDLPANQPAEPCDHTFGTPQACAVARLGATPHQREELVTDVMNAALRSASGARSRRASRGSRGLDRRRRPRAQRD
jgi:hypothetical protein